MKEIGWTGAYRVGIPEIDEQHMRFFEIANTIRDPMPASDAEMPHRVLTELEEYVAFHFRTEEDYFDRSGYPDAKEHILEHRSFIEIISGFRSEYRRTGTFNPATVRVFMKDWMIRHILISDRKYISHFREGGLKE